MMNSLVLDLETTTQRYKKRTASSFCPENWVVASGYAHNKESEFCNYFADRDGFKHHYIPIRPNTQTLVGFNIKFDLLYMWRKPELREFFARGGKVWDCQYVHYLLQGQVQSAHMASMDSVIEEYGGQLKIDEVKALWEEGVDTPEIPNDLLMDYLAGDIRNTRIIYEAQIDLAQKMHPNTMQMIWNRMDGLLSTTEMEYRGLIIDEITGEHDRFILQKEYEGCITRLDHKLPTLPEEFRFNWQSNHHRSYFLFGGIAHYDKWMPHLNDKGERIFSKQLIKTPVLHLSGEPVRYLSGKRQGQPKFKNVQVDNLDKPKGKIQKQFYTFKDPITKPKKEWESSLVDAMQNPIYRTSADIIEELSVIDNPVLKTMAKAQKLSKDIGTYYWSEDKNGKRKGMLTLVGVDGRIHHKLNHTSTVTSRLSSSDPNMQNIPRGDKSLAKRMFISRFGTSGRIIEIDYSQLEVIVQGVLSGDKHLLRDIREGVDFHVKRLAASTGKDYGDLKRLHLAGDTDIATQRTAIKGFTFARAYGAGATSIAAQTGMAIEQVKDLIAAEEAMYPDVSRFDHSVERDILDTARRSKEPKFVDDIMVYPKTGYWMCPTGTKYKFIEKESPEFMKERGTYVSFSPTERKNYPVQGLGGEIVQTMIGKVWRRFVETANYEENAYIINTVHDCLLIDCHKDYIPRVAKEAAHILERVPNVFNYYFNMKINVPFSVNVEVGPNWYDMEHYNVERV